MSKNTSISLGDHYESFIANKIGSGRYQSASEVIRAGLRLLEFEEKKIELLKESLKAGEESGFSDNFDPKNHLEGLHKQYL